MKKQCKAKRILLTVIMSCLFLPGCGVYTGELSAEDKLKRAMETGEHEVLKEAVEEGVDLNWFARDNGEWTENGKFDRNPMRVGMFGSMDLYSAEYMLRSGADVNAYDAYGYPLMFYGLWEDDEALVKLFLQYGADISLEGKEGMSALDYYFCEGGLDYFYENCFGFAKKTMVEILLDHGAKVDCQTMEYAKEQGAYHVMGLLYSKLEDQENCVSELQRKYFEGKLTEGNELLKKSGKLVSADLFAAVTYGNEETVKILEKKEIDFSQSYGEPHSLLSIAAWNGNVQTVSRIVDGMVLDKNELDEILYAAYSNDDLELIKLLCDKGYVDLKKLTDSQLQSVSEENAIAVMEYFLSSGCDLKKLPSKGAAELLMALYRDNDEMAKLLLENGADPSRMSDDTYPFEIACRYGTPYEVKLMIEAGTDLKKLGKIGMDAALEGGDFDIIKILTEHGVAITEAQYKYYQEMGGSNHILEYLTEYFAHSKEE
ncbi:Ribulose-5-phosphate 4-epimerase and related epimerases and aldolases [uncultured Roseburia sp.]|uniref:Ankyrin repeat protein n=1 Tax=Brotonthovivens ammoniilytica TaxID=2981725 RepID=A0ABT2TK19_9FIRM|nr:hypothetical protein [Brotonthovivens ammoniilytica]MCU6762540.1 hypothetical protein [Brotonthovivens ammoniilytica]SCI75146.1 Ribulose-5-phosphate 4-epimerase and related epimerases and aldolases [uncultured Roseburia sp.]